MAQGEVVIRIKRGGTVDGTAIDNETGQLNAQTPNIPSANAKNIISMSVARSALQYVKRITLESGEYAINRHFQLEDDYIGKRDTNIAINMCQRAGQLGMSVATGFMVGGVIGAVVAGVGNIALQGIDVAKNLDQQNIKLAQLDEQLSFTREKVGYALTDGSVGRNK